MGFNVFHRLISFDVQMTFTLDFQTPILGSQTQQRSRILNSNKATETETAVEINSQAWTYAQKTGELQQDGKHVATGYSGAGEGKNNPDLQSARNVGPIPQGGWTIAGPPVNTPEHGPYVLRLTPQEKTETFGRDGFLMHGDSKNAPGTASHGCVIMPRTVREQVWNSGDRDLQVVAEIPAPLPDKK
jgi:Protein of unknown function (DUF2778)